MLKDFWNSFTTKATQADEAVKRHFLRKSMADRRAGIARVESNLANGRPDVMGKEIATQFKLDDAQRDAVIARLKDPAQSAGVAAEYAHRMNRGMNHVGRRGPMESVHRGIAGNAVLRRGVLPAAIGGGGLLAGAAVTTGAQNLMALMEFMQGGQAQQERVENSPLT